MHHLCNPANNIRSFHNLVLLEYHKLTYNFLIYMPTAPTFSFFSDICIRLLKTGILFNYPRI